MTLWTSYFLKSDGLDGEDILRMLINYKYVSEVNMSKVMHLCCIVRQVL